MKKVSLLIIVTLLGGSIFFTFSCKKATVDTNTQTAQDLTLCQNEFMRILPCVNSIAILNLAKVKSIARTSGIHYPNYNATDTAKFGSGWPRTLTINYGLPPGVQDSSDGKTRSGIITVTFGNYWHTLGTPAIVTFSNYYVNGVNFSGSLTITRTSSTTFKVTGNGLANGSGFTDLYNAGYWIYTWTSNVKDLNPAHAQFSITGNGTGTDRNQVKYMYNTIAPLYKNNNCGYISAGSMSIEPAGLATRTLTFNAGASGCSNSATVTIDGQNYNISM